MGNLQHCSVLSRMLTVKRWRGQGRLKSNHHVNADSDPRADGLGEPAPDAVQPADEQRADGPAKWDQHEVPRGEHHWQGPQASREHGRVGPFYTYTYMYMDFTPFFGRANYVAIIGFFLLFVCLLLKKCDLIKLFFQFKPTAAADTCGLGGRRADEV